MAGDARAELPAPAAPPLPVVPEKRVVREEDDGEGERLEPKRRRASVAPLDGVSSAAAAAAADGEAEEEDGHLDEEGSFFSFQHARGGFVALETTPKFGSFHPPAPLAEQQEALDPKPAPPHGEDPPLVGEEGAASARGVGDGEDGNSGLVAAVGDQAEPGGQNDSE